MQQEGVQGEEPLELEKMRDRRPDVIATTANIGKHPLHPTLISFPITLLMAPSEASDTLAEGMARR